MVPSAFVFLKEMPMTSNGKVNKKALAETELTRNELESKYVSPESSQEIVLAGIWQEILGIDKVGVNDNFFELGGDSIISIQIIARAAQEGMKITPKQMFKYQTIAQLSSVLDNELTHPLVNQDAVTGAIKLTPVQHWFFEQNLPEPDHFNHSVLLKVPKGLNPDFLKEAVKELMKHHDALRLKFIPDDSGWIQSNEGFSEQVPFSVTDLSGVKSDDLNKALEKNISGLQTSLSLSEGKLINVRFYKTADEEYDRLFITIHHLCTDGISWRILLEDIYNAYRQINSGEEIKLPPKTNSFKDWSESLIKYSNSETILKEKDFWLKPAEEIFLPLQRDILADNELNTVESNDTVIIESDELKTQSLLKDVPKAFNTQINDILLTALIIAYNKLTNEYNLFINLEGHGREEIFEGVDVSRTAGWFTSIYPVVLKLYDKNNIGETIKSTKEILREIPDSGIGFGVLKYLSNDNETKNQIKSIPYPEISFNYMGQFNENISSDSAWKLGKDSIILSQNKSGIRPHLIEINGIITGNKLKVYFNYSKNIHKRQTIISFAEFYRDALENVIQYCTSDTAGGYTPSDFSTSGLNQQELDNLLANLN
ncbi:MAG: hypothetical protein IPL53_16625 [Ignavibacteria bacterium]|nr:hypothetical protein [Ignavibacteria bacterium]